jgi:hypothetical protein
MKIRFLPAVILFACLTGVTNAALTISTYNFSGILSDPFGNLPAGTSFQGSFTYDSGQPLNITDPNRGDYVYQNFAVTILGQVANSGTGVINMYNNPGYPTDMFLLYTTDLNGSFGGIALTPGAGMQLVLQNVQGNVFSDLSVLKPNLSLADFTTGNATFLQLQGLLGSGDLEIARGQITSLKAVPEPSSFLGSLTLTGLILLRRRR